MTLLRFWDNSFYSFKPALKESPSSAQNSFSLTVEVPLCLTSEFDERCLHPEKLANLSAILATGHGLL